MVEKDSLNNTDFAAQKTGMVATPRIEYIDAMRGFTILLVVINHVSTFDLGLFGSEVFSYNRIFGEFRMPLFFFVSGLVLYKSSFIWNFENTVKFINKKYSVQIISPLLFMFIFCLCNDINFRDALFDYQKQGYWFTFTLMTYYIFYILICQTNRVLKCNGIVEDVIVIFVGVILYCATVYSVIERCHLNCGIASLVGIPTWHNFLFFLIGTRVKKHFCSFEKVLDTRFLLMVAISLLTLLLVCPSIERISSTGYHLLIALSGVVVTIAFFRRNESFFSKTKVVGRISQFVGRRTLDIYLLHYFFVFSNMQNLLPNFGILKSPFIEFSMSLIISIFVIVSCLFVSSVIRLSPELAHMLFGQKYER